jgi:hypothetical protein
LSVILKEYFDFSADKHTQALDFFNESLMAVCIELA